MVDAPVWLDLASIVVAALGGALFATRRGVTLTGVLLTAICVGLGGGIIRDLLLDVGPPLAISDPAYLPAAALAALAGILLVRTTTHLATPLMVLDGVALGLFAVVGAERSLVAGYPGGSAILIGVVAASAGGIIRDLLAGEPPSMMQAGPWDASAALVGTSLLVLAARTLDVPTRLVEWPIIVLIAAISILSVRLGWRAPMAHDVAPALGLPIAVVREQIARAGSSGRAPRLRVRSRQGPSQEQVRRARSTRRSSRAAAASGGSAQAGPAGQIASPQQPEGAGNP